MSSTEVKANQPALEMFTVTLNWGQQDEGTYSEYVLATSQNEACFKVAESMAEQREYVDDLETPEEKREWISGRAWDIADCHFVEDSLASDLAALYGDVLFPDGVKETPNKLPISRKWAAWGRRKDRFSAADYWKTKA